MKGHGAFGFRKGNTDLHEAFNAELKAFLGSPGHRTLVDRRSITTRCAAIGIWWSALPQASFATNGDLVDGARLVKSPAEIALMREAGGICTSAIDGATEVMGAGVPQQKVIAAILEQLALRVPGSGGDHAAIVPLMPVAEGTSPSTCPGPTGRCRTRCWR